MGRARQNPITRERERERERERGQMGKLVARIILVACAYMRVPKG